jgi:hypothetical protein
MLFTILRQSVNQNGIFNITDMKIEWANYKQSTYDLQDNNVLSTITLAKYLYRSQNYLDTFRGYPARQSHLECADALLSGINPRRQSFIWHKYSSVTAVKPTYSNLEVDQLQSYKNQPLITDEPVVNHITTVNLPAGPPSSLVASSPVD